MEEDVLLKNIINKVGYVSLVSNSFFKKDFEKLKNNKFKFVILSLNRLFIKIDYIHNGIIDAYSSKNFYVINILKRTLMEAYFKHLYIYSRSLREDSDDVGKEYIKTLKSAENLSAFRFISNYHKESNIILDNKTIKWSTKGEKNEKIKKIGNKFDLKQIFHDLLRNINDNSKNVVGNIFREEYFIKYIEEYSKLSSFVHAGSYSDKVFETFQLSKNKDKIFDDLLKNSFYLYEYTVKNTFHFFSLINTELYCHYKLIESIFSKNINK